MHRLPLADQLPYRFHPPALSPFWVRATRGYRRKMLRGEHQVVDVDVDGLGRLGPLLERGDGIILAPNHCGRADGLLMLDLAERAGRPCCAMAAHQIFEGNAGLRHWLFPRLGIFPVDREGTDLAAFKAAVEVVSAAKHPLLVFPEGEVYYLADRLTPLRDGTAALALTAAKRLADSGKTAWIVPIGIKYRFPEGFDPLPAFRGMMDSLEARLTWRPKTGRPLVERIYGLAEALLTLKEIEYFGAAQAGPLKGRIARFRSDLLGRLEDRRLGRRREDSVPVRVKELRRACLDALADPKTTPDEVARIREDLHDVFLVVQAFSYPGDYVAECPTLERVAETLMKLDEDLLGAEPAPPLGPRKAVVRLGEPIDVGAHLREGRKPRQAIPLVTTELESRMQALLDAIGPGRSCGEGPPVE